jgi:hypothetical protein
VCALTICPATISAHHLLSNKGIETQRIGISTAESSLSLVK